MSEQIAISVQEVSKTFKLPHEKSTSIKSAIINFSGKKKSYEKQQVLSDISFNVEKGDFFGIVGRNGSGKSTLLKLLAGIYSPDKGAIHINGRLTPFIELGVGFNPELTGRENVFLNGALLGFNRSEMDEMYEEIVEFAELERFMDQKLKNYSSGMQVRLAFSIAIRAQSDILLLDEVLAVGDEAFQKKCIAVFERYKAAKQTVVLVTHDMSVVEKYCNKAILIDKGNIIKSGNPREVAHEYSRMNRERYIESKNREEARRQKLKKLEDWKVKIQTLDKSGKPTTSYKYGSDARIRISWEEDTIKNIGVAMLRQSGEYVFGANTILDSYRVNNQTVEYTIKLNVGTGDYEFKIGLFGEKESDVLEFIDDGPSIFVEAPSKRTWEGVTNLDHHWR